ncbi:S1-C subfamily serine protease [Rhodoligotrophos appendicifer]|uniref:S1 family peptidase n=1 Tax=Rhodoligotrophos appendicifer TaxID=987056 RepID=UPI001186114B|nr:serine protease [Rhodoligotrophos appendicifer]
MKRLAVMVLSAMALTGCVTSQVTNPRVINIAATPTPASAQIAGSIQHLVDQTSATYVTLVVHNSPGRKQLRDDSLSEAVASGSGFLIDDQGTVVTAGHVGIEKGWMVEARGPDGRIYQGNVVALSYSPDVAVIKLKDMTGNASVQPASARCLRPGEPVFSLGKPRAEGDIARTGELAALHFERPVTYAKFGYPDAMVLKLSTRRGESGGPVFNDRGELIGMVVSTLSDKTTGAPLDLAHALPASMVAQTVCSSVSCSAAWKQLATQKPEQCPAL